MSNYPQPVDNPSLLVEPRSKVASILPSSGQVSILDWLETTGRLIARESEAVSTFTDAPDELNELMLGEDSSYLDDEDDDDATLDDDDEEVL
jgi:hypothetical protein